MKTDSTNLNEILEEVSKMTRKEISEKVADILTIREKPQVRYTSRGAGYVHPFDIIASRSGRAALDRYSRESED